MKTYLGWYLLNEAWIHPDGYAATPPEEVVEKFKEEQHRAEHGAAISRRKEANTPWPAPSATNKRR
jgi:hypothetical protein